MRICAATCADVDAVVKLIEAYWRYDNIGSFDEPRIATQVRELLAKPHLGRVWLAFVDDDIQGYLICTFVYSFEHGGLMAEVDELFVRERARGHGCGRRLIEHAVAELAASGCRALQMQVADGNLEAQRFYSRLGYSERAGYRLWIKRLE